MSVWWRLPYTPFLYKKTGVYQGIHYFLIFALKHRLWVLVRTASARWFLRVPTIYVLSKTKKNNTFFLLKTFNFTVMKYCSILPGHVCVMNPVCIKSGQKSWKQVFSWHGSYNSFQDSVLVENMHDVPYLHTSAVGPEVVATMTMACSKVRETFTRGPVGVQVLAGANEQALAIAQAAGTVKFLNFLAHQKTLLWST